MGAAMQFGSNKSGGGQGLPRLVEQGSVYGSGQRSLESFAPGGAYLLTLRQENSGVLNYQGAWLLSTPQRARFDADELLGAVFGAAGSNAPTVTLGIGGVGIQPYSASCAVNFALYKVG